MFSRIGVWLDYRKALIVRVNDEGIDLVRISSDVERKHRSTGGVRSRWPWWHRSSRSSDVLGIRRGHEVHKYFQDISRATQGADDLYIFGPGTAKTGLKNFLAKHLKTTLADEELESAESRLTEGEIIAQVRRYFGRSAPRLDLTDRQGQRV